MVVSEFSPTSCWYPGLIFNGSDPELYYFDTKITHLSFGKHFFMKWRKNKSLYETTCNKQLIKCPTTYVLKMSSADIVSRYLEYYGLM